jgi:hypothetical protein
MTLGRRSLRLVSAVCVSVIALAACGDDTPPAAPINPKDTPLVGTWQGPVGGTWGESTVTLVLNSDSTLTADTDYQGSSGGVYREHLEGVWTVSGSQFTGTGYGDNGGLVVTFLAGLSRPTLRLSGTWSASNGSHGTFDTVKQ